MISAVVSCLALLALLFGMVAWDRREQIKQFFAEIVEAWNVQV